MTTKLLLIAALAATTSLFLDTREAQAQGRQNYNRGFNRGLNTQIYGNQMNYRPAYSNYSRGVRTYTPYSYYPSNYRTYSQYGYPNNYGYSNNYGYPNGFSNTAGYSYPSNYGYGMNYGNYYGYRPGVVNSFRSGNNGFGYYQSFVY
ncbi:MAG: hypothetical protein Q8M16_22615 [Pirellulaceae bacterium]|nr:hypothetical protein [Pirellulaceae bacterium]